MNTMSLQEASKAEQDSPYEPLPLNITAHELI